MYNKVEDFLKDDQFIKYVLNEAPESALYWKEILGEHSELLKVFEEAKFILLAPEDVKIDLESSEKDELKQRIFATLEIDDMIIN